MHIPHDKAAQAKQPTITCPTYSATIDYLGKNFDVDYVISPDHNGDDVFTVESITHDSEEWGDYLQCMYVYFRQPPFVNVLETAFEAINRIIEEQHKEPEPEYDSTIVDGE